MAFVIESRTFIAKEGSLGTILGHLFNPSREREKSINYFIFYGKM